MRLVVFSLLFVVSSVCAASKWRKPEIQTGKMKGNQEALPDEAVAAITIRTPGGNKNMKTLLNTNGVAVAYQTIMQKMKENGQAIDPERFLEILAYLFEVSEWGPKGPPGGFSIGRKPSFIHPVGGAAGRKKRSANKKVATTKVRARFVWVPKAEAEKIKLENKRVEENMKLHRMAAKLKTSSKVHHAPSAKVLKNRPVEPHHVQHIRTSHPAPSPSHSAHAQPLKGNFNQFKNSGKAAHHAANRNVFKKSLVKSAGPLAAPHKHHSA